MPNVEIDALSDELKLALRDDLRRFWSRLVYFLGMMVGLIPLITLPAHLFVISSVNPASVALARVVNAATVLPASALAYRYRGLASWWLLLDAAVCIFAGIEHPAKGAENWVLLGLAVGIPLFLGGFGLITGWTGWPPLLERKRKVTTEAPVSRF
jgi:hypothetical protein